jgi:hypothetical protein
VTDPGSRYGSDGVPMNGRGRFAVGPEGVAAVMSLATIAVVAVVLFGGRPGAPGSAEPTPIASASSSPAPTVTVDRAGLTAALQVDARLLADGTALSAELAAARFEAGNVAAILRSTNAEIVAAAGIADRIAQSPVTHALGLDLAAAWKDLHGFLSDALGNSIQNAAAYRSAARGAIVRLGKLAAIDSRLRSALVADVQPTPTPAGSGPAGSGSPGPSGAIPSPSGPTASASVSPAAGLVNPGFEAGVGAPWELVLSAPASATLTGDSSMHHLGARAARVDITIPGEERAGISLRQGGLSIAAGSQYQATVWVLSSAAREVRLRIASGAGDTYATRLCTAGPTWSDCSVEATVFATDPAAYLEIDLGRFAETTWIDDASFQVVGPSSS